MKRFPIITAYIFLLSILPTTITAVPATPYPVIKILPDGTEISILLRGDEFFSYELTTDGFLIRENNQGFYEYAMHNEQGQLLPTGVRVSPEGSRTAVELQLISNLESFPDLSAVNMERRIQRAAETEATGVRQNSYPRTGSPKSIVILVNFKNLSFVTPDPKTAFTNLLNEEGYSANGGTGSARDYFTVASNGVSSPEFVVVGPYTLPNDRSYYGENDANGNDLRPRQMVIDACTAAFNDGVDFSIYDTDGDGIVDNVFIYYAGHNEAEGGPKESIWPHRWALNTTLILNGKTIFGYACTSELRGSSGSNMCGIGTFAHEFGHVYGLVDYYPTNGASHHTLSYWNIMDAGAYLNQGRTPPTYSAYDRFYVGWITPTILKSPQDVSLADLKDSNKAYIITQTGNHNLNGANPSPNEFFTLENRQRKGWDAFLPNSGMLITRIVYNATTWRNNTPNNNASAMGVDLIEADGIANVSTLAGDPFPGTQNITSFTPRLMSGTELNMPLTFIKQENGMITFRFMGGGNPPTIVTDQQKLQQFSTVLGNNSESQSFIVSGKNLKSNITVSFTESNHFELRFANENSTQWSKKLTLVAIDSVVADTPIEIRYSPTEASFNETHFDYLTLFSEDADLQQTIVAGKSSRPVYVVPPVAQQPTSISMEGFTASWNDVFDASGYYLTVYNIAEGSSVMKEGFSKGLQPAEGWTINATTTISNSAYAGDSIPAIQLSETGEYIQTEKFWFPTKGLSFFVRSIGETEGRIMVEAYNGTEWTVLDAIEVSISLRSTKSYNFSETLGYEQFRIRFLKGTAYVAIDDVAVTLAQQVEYNARSKWVNGTSEFISLLIPGRTYYYTVRASDKTLNLNNTLKYENITDFSNIVTIELENSTVTRMNSPENEFTIFKDASGTVLLKKEVISETLNMIYVYSAQGKLMKVIESAAPVVQIENLTRNKAYIIKAGNTAVKMVL